MMTTYELARKQASAPSAELLNALLGQREALAAKLARCDGADEFAAALGLLRLFAPVWEACGYGYKVKELAGTAVNLLYRKESEAKDVRDNHYRKNSSQWMFWDSEAKKLADLIADFCILRSGGE
jgi:hypothetical protein